MRRVPLTGPDRVLLQFDLDHGSCIVGIEVRVEGTLEDERLRSAVSTAMARHPMARAQLVRAGDEFYWGIAEIPDRLPLQVRDCPDDASLHQMRIDFLHDAPGLDLLPPFDLLVAHHPEGDRLIFSLHHAVGDGVGGFRLLASILRAYVRLPDPIPELDPLAARDLRSLPGHQGIRGGLKRVPLLARSLARASGEAAQVASGGGQEGSSERGVSLVRLDSEEMATVLARKRPPATLNDVLLAGFAVAARRWNDARGFEPTRMVLTVPVNVRPAEWSAELIANMAISMPISINEQAQLDFNRGQLALAEGTQSLKESAKRMAHGGSILPKSVKRLVKPMLPRASAERTETAIVTNMGRSDLPAELGEEAGRLLETWLIGAPPMPNGVSMAAVSMGKELFLTCRYTRRLFDGQHGDEFLTSIRDVLLGR